MDASAAERGSSISLYLRYLLPGADRYNLHFSGTEKVI
jgi:hypothetical protein